MSKKSQKIRAERREKMAMRWPETIKPESVRIRNGLVRSSEAGVGFNRPSGVDPA